jgi:hypothetical protein
MSSSGSPQFDRLQAAFASDPALRQETEWAFRLAVETYNPSDRGLRFITGGIGEWIVTLAAYKAGVITLPEGHNADGYDTRDLLAQAKQLWSVKTSYQNDRNYRYTITNGRDGPGPGLIVPTIFLSPTLPGFVFVDPTLHADVVALQDPLKDSMQLASRHVGQHAAARPECVIPFTMPPNPGAPIRDPGLEAVRLLLDNPMFPRLSAMFHDTARSATTVVEQLKELAAMRDTGALTEDAYRAAVQKVTSL